MTPDVKPFQRNYVTELCRCAEMERKLLYMEGEMQKDKISIVEYNSIEPKALPLHETATLEVSRLKRFQSFSLMQKTQKRNIYFLL